MQGACFVWAVAARAGLSTNVYEAQSTVGSVSSSREKCASHGNGWSATYVLILRIPCARTQRREQTRVHAPSPDASRDYRTKGGDGVAETLNGVSNEKRRALTKTEERRWQTTFRDGSRASESTVCALVWSVGRCRGGRARGAQAERGIVIRARRSRSAVV
ncbi:hypothetical protein IWX49DRAFT_120663 [Phyllosticta citricarpa]|uniref:Secreted protein n=1 Tax=Phyllosticta citricarpa TaxID=55181 RepID=A0ABR1MCZ8_9PEZI